MYSLLSTRAAARVLSFYRGPGTSSRLFLGCSTLSKTQILRAPVHTWCDRGLAKGLFECEMYSPDASISVAVCVHEKAVSILLKRETSVILFGRIVCFCTNERHGFLHVRPSMPGDEPFMSRGQNL